MKKIVYSMLFLFSVGVAGTLISVSASGGFSLDTYNVGDQVVVNNKNISDIEVELSSTDVTVHSTSDKEITVELNGKISKKLKKKLNLDVKEKGDTLKISLDGEDQIKFNIGVLIIDTNIDIYLPEKLYDSINVDISSGDIDLKELKAKEYSLETSSGDISAKDIDGVQSNINATSGDIDLKNVKGDISIVSTSGDINIHNKEVFGNIETKATSGDVTVEFDKQPESLAIDFNATSGDGKVSLDGVSYEEKTEDEIRGKIGTGEYKLIVDITSGDFVLR
ncbi:DUF4097 family beta strand repeat-containing protein [Bacillus sp. CGMCC 1.16607]|uniref:DUF4097 family beta strand repeat-containing protein n=1 Tax=Bacillus sp. CGMCC 1.16607 TaxID=3351842 RepID=UPI0036280417